MAKQSKKEQKEKRDLELILEQVKQNIVSEPTDEQSSNPDDQDEELISMLSKVFSDAPSPDASAKKSDSESAEETEEIAEVIVEAEEQTEITEAVEEADISEASAGAETQTVIDEVPTEAVEEAEISEAAAEVETQAVIDEAPTKAVEEAEISQNAADVEVQAVIDEVPTEAVEEAEISEAAAEVETQAVIDEAPTEAVEEADISEASAEVETQSVIDEAPTEAVEEAEISEAAADVEVQAVIDEVPTEAVEEADISEATAEVETQAVIDEAPTEAVEEADISEVAADVEVQAVIDEAPTEAVEETDISEAVVEVKQYETSADTKDQTESLETIVETATSDLSDTNNNCNIDDIEIISKVNEEEVPTPAESDFEDVSEEFVEQTEQNEDDEELTVTVEDEEYDTESPLPVSPPTTESLTAVEEREDSKDKDADASSPLILSVDQYTVDPLQEGLPISIKGKKMSTIDQATETNSSEQASSEKGFDINDISLLLKFGYDEEVKSKHGEDTTQEAILARDNYYVPEKHRIPFGYCGKEFTDRAQIPAIKSKYKTEKHAIIAKLIAVSIIATLILCSTIFFEFFSDRSSYPLILSVEILLLLIIGGILGRKLYEGVLGIIRFEAGQYAILFFTLFANLSYNIVTLICYAANRSSILNLKSTEFMLFSFTVSVHAVLALVSDLINCIKESETFEIIASSDSLYTAERQSSKTINASRSMDDDDTPKSNYLHSNEHAYKLRKTRLISGYFKKTSMNKSGNVNLIYLLGVVPIISLVIGCICALLGGDLMRGVSSVMLTVLLCVPFSFLFTHSISEFIFSSDLKEQKIAFIGNESPVEYAQTDTVIVNDCDAVEIISYKEIQPGKNANVKKYVSTAYEVFSALGGTLSEIAAKEAAEAEGQEIVWGDHELIINEITENGIHIYYDSSQNILLGDRNYMRDHGINVKTDTNLTTATKGNDKAVIYVAFDGSPQLGFILQSKIKGDFHDFLDVLNDENIRIFVESYEPHINDQFFETNKENISVDIKVHKPDEYEDPHNRQICDGRVISAKDALSLAKAIPLSREILAQRKRIGRIHLALVAGGIFVSCLLTLLLNVRNGVPVLGFMKSHITLLFNIFMVCGCIPSIVCLTKLNKNNRSKK